ncbi:unnamed protein product [Mycena citricolor]|uniref:Uncharacterized protein n=1 Tax=Mycena citricolor TaxID=2018698 RepID=A0AAD2GXD6_9AGAR|nr:unnamed protein product [Mycena citricolor]CAK5276969.1 unnamed protein product [Mycena citricolor]
MPSGTLAVSVEREKTYALRNSPLTHNSRALSSARSKFSSIRRVFRSSIARSNAEMSDARIADMNGEKMSARIGNL